MVYDKNFVEEGAYFAFYILEYTARRTKNRRSDLIRHLSSDYLRHLMEYSDVYHTEPLNQTILEEFHIRDGSFDNVGDCRYSPPTVREIANVYRRLFCAVTANMETVSFEQAENLIRKMYDSPLDDWIQDYNAAYYYANPGEIYCDFMEFLQKENS